jgi:hypothetical protein
MMVPGARELEQLTIEVRLREAKKLEAERAEEASRAERARASRASEVGRAKAAAAKEAEARKLQPRAEAAPRARGSVSRVTFGGTLFLALSAFYLVAVLPLQTRLSQTQAKLNALTNTMNANAEALESLTETVNHNARIANLNNRVR